MVTCNCHLLLIGHAHNDVIGNKCARNFTKLPTAEFSFSIEAIEVECAEVLVSLLETVKMNLDKVNEKKCTKALCCTEIFIEMASSFRSQSATYSSYKVMTLLKG